MTILTNRFCEIKQLEGLQKLLLVTLSVGNFLNGINKHNYSENTKRKGIRI
jgi:hypothetical protein